MSSNSVLSLIIWLWLEAQAPILLALGLALKYLSEIELVEFYKCCDWVIAPYESIFTSGTIACAIGFNKPIIAPKIGLIPNYVSRQSGILYNNNDECGLLSTLKNSRKFLKSKKKY